MNPALTLDRGRVVELCRRWRIVELALFGSAVREDFRDDSDVDVLVTFAPEAKWTLLDLVGLRDELQGLVGRDVDLVEERALKNPFRRARILSEKQVLFAA